MITLMSVEDKIKDKLLEAGVNNLKEYGYPEVNKETILTDLIYKGFFKSMLKDNLGKSNKVVDGIINDLLTEINKD
jgi:hypothetical protein